MITHRIGADTRVVFPWELDEETPTPITDATLTIDGTINDDLLDHDTLEGSVEVHIPEGHVILEGNHTYELRATDGTDWRILSGGLLRVKHGDPSPDAESD